MAKKILRHGIIGLGVGQWLHLPGFQKLEEVEVLAIADADRKKLEMVSRKFGIERCYADFRELCRDPDIDSVSVCLPNFLHAEAGVCALKSGKHVLCEKPLAHKVSDGKKIVEAARKSKKVAMMAMKFRFTPEAHCIRKLRDAGKLGRVYYSSTTYLRPPGGIPGMGGWFTTKKLSGGGTLIDNGVHFLDLQWYLMGCPKPVHAMGVNSADFGPRYDGHFDVEDFATGVIRFENVAAAVLTNAWVSMTSKGVWGLHCLGTKGGATMWPFSVSLGSEKDAKDVTPDVKKLKGDSEFRHFVNCILKREECISPVEEGLVILKMLDGLYRSSESGRGVSIK